MKPVYVAASPFQPCGWLIADGEGMPVSGTPTYRDKKSCLRAIANLRG